MLIILFSALFLLPFVAFICFIYSYYVRHHSIIIPPPSMDLNTMTTFRSLLLGVVNNKSSFLQNEDVTCFYQHTSSNGSMVKHQQQQQQVATATMSTNDTGHGHVSTTTTAQSTALALTKNEDRSRLKSVDIDYLPARNFSFHPYELNMNVSNDNGHGDGGHDDDQQGDGDGDGKQGSGSKSLLVLFAWLFAKERHLDKYRRLYLDQGFDVLTIKCYVKDFIIPAVGSHVIAAKVVNFIKERHEKYEAMLFHSFSVGAYQTGEVLVMLNQKQNLEVKNIVRKLLKGMVYDSAADINEAPVGLSKATTTNPWLQWAITSLMYAHYRWCYHLATRHYIASSQVVHQNEFGCPTLVFLSKDDEVVNHLDQITTVVKWRSKGVNVMLKCWEQSPHVSHFFKHPEEYRSTVIEFLKIVMDHGATEKKKKK